MNKELYPAQREGFEAWAEVQYYDLTRKDNGKYHNNSVQYAWLGWQAAQQADRELIVELVEAMGKARDQLIQHGMAEETSRQESEYDELYVAPLKAAIQKAQQRLREV